jgi:hypothetical protein
MLILAESKYAANGTPQPVAVGGPLAAVESPAMKSVGRAGLRVLAVTGSADARGGGSVGSLEVGAVVGAARSARVKKAVSENIVGIYRTWVAEGVRPSLRSVG